PYMPTMIPLSVLDLSPVPQGSTPGEALRNSRRLAAHVEALGYNRFWMAEHHNMPGIASSSPAVLIAHLAASTSSLRLGSGGVMLPNHAPLVVAEQFGTLAALHPGRIDLGIGRAPGTDPATAAALRRRAEGLHEDEFPEQLGQLTAFLDGRFPDGHPFGAIQAVPSGRPAPALWLLGSSGYSAQVAALLGLPFAFAHHFMPANTLPALELYRSRFRPSAVLDEPYALIGVAVVCADTDERARWLHGSSQLSMLRLRTGRPGLLPSAEEAAAYPYTPGELAVVEAATGAHVVGAPETVADRLDELLEATGADELMVTTNVHDHAARLRSYELVAELAGLQVSGEQRAAAG
ncbi:MAG TPA: LLM class flavin-dependent oxidoreductase, partial [Acidimicrobiales bacterium]|nr:LLM class flavin-dependent oxidoreductase [Acidimicrobiales bacterium]